MSPTERKKRILDTIQVAVVVGEYQPLHRTGTTLQGACPFHNDGSTSLEVDPAGRRFWCRACGASGDVADYLCMHDHLTVVLALETLEARAGL
jgi:DNA primase